MTMYPHPHAASNASHWVIFLNFVDKRSQDAASAPEITNTLSVPSETNPCSACGGPHPAMARSCPKYALAKAATSISVREGVLYSDAHRLARKNQHQASTTPEATDTGNTDDHCSSEHWRTCTA